VIEEQKIEEEEIYYINSIGLQAKGMLTNEGFVVFKGSQSNSEFKEASSPSLRNKWLLLKENGSIDSNNLFSKDYLFGSPSTAAGIILGRNANGLTEWKNKDKQSLKSQLEKESDKLTEELKNQVNEIVKNKIKETIKPISNESIDALFEETMK